MSMDELPVAEREEIVECTDSRNMNELTGIVVLQNEEGKDQHLEDLSGIGRLQEQASTSSNFKESENMHELSTIITDVYALSGERFGHDLIQFIEPHGHSLENWQHQAYSQIESDTFPHNAQIDTGSNPLCNADMQSTREASVTLTVLNSTNTDEAAQSVPFPFSAQQVRHSSLIDHDYCKNEYPVTECLPENNTILLQEQNDIGMDQEKLQRMKRRKEKNRECSRQFRLKQKGKEQRLTHGKVEKTKTLDTMKKNVEKFKAILSKISQKCASCPKTAMLLNQYVTGYDKENINPSLEQDFFK